MSSTGQGTGIARTVGANIRIARKERRELQREFATALGVSPQQLSDWERGAYRPNDGNLTRIAEHVGKEFAWFFAQHDLNGTPA